ERACRILEEAELDGWTASLVTAGIELAPTLRALDEVLSAGTDAWNERRFTELARVLRLAGLALVRNGKVLVAVGGGGEPTVWSAGRIEIRTMPPPSGAVRAALDLLARRLDAACEAQDHDEPSPGDLLGRSMAMHRVREEIERWGPLPMTVLILGEAGTGKELVARELHRTSERHGSFVALNCAGLPAPLLEAELFGVTRGAFTGADRDRIGLVEAAEGGTLFLDEIGELPLELQGKLLRLIQEHEVRRVGATRSRIVDTRFLAATNRQLEAAVEAGLFRQDLYFRLAVAVITVPPLRVRGEDVDDLARHFVRVFAGRFNRPGVHLAPAALAVLRGAPWPGNVRE
ncbi:MAG: sigma-54-dependent Fis family transcriptional regulator, partial [Acidobacteria bacterium]|nr:sigma-54-dependent Fis family transcriptional regulator [Acidobacteriota bacterium]